MILLGTSEDSEVLEALVVDLMTLETLALQAFLHSSKTSQVVAQAPHQLKPRHLSRMDRK